MVSKLTNQIEEGLEKRKQLENPLGITYRDFRFSYSLDYLGKVFNLLSELCSLQNSFDEMDSFAKNCFLRENAIDELELKDCIRNRIDKFAGDYLPPDFDENVPFEF